MLGLQTEFTTEQLAEIQIIASVSGSLSVVSIVFVLSGILGFRGKNVQWNFSSAILSTLLALNLLFSLGSMFGRSIGEINAGFCSFQGFLLQFAGVATMLWMSIIAYYMYLWIVRRKHADRITRRLNRDILIVILLSSIPAFTYLGLDYYRVTPLWCWVDSEYENAR